MLLMRSESIAALAAQLARQIRDALRAAVGTRGTASLLVPGGRTPVPLFRALRGQDLPWRQVNISLTDERWVSPEDSGSNERLVRTELLVDAAAEACFVSLYNAAPGAEQGAAQSWRRLGALAQPFDVVVLGMGNDGHFASLFPESPGLAAALDPDAAPDCVAMRAPVAPIDRVSLNLAALANARQLFLLISGQHKLGLIESAATRARLPIDALLALRHPDPRVCWAP
jgi:6-phosphogluconolactonase